MKNKILFLGPESHYDLISKQLSDSTIFFHNTEKEVDKLIDQVDCILDAYMKVPFPQERLKNAKKLKLFITATTGASHIDTVYLEKNNIPLLTLKGQEQITRKITAAAEHSWLLLLSVARQLSAAIEETRSGGWDRNKFPGTMLIGKTIGIIGCGRIGQWMARYANAFGMKVLGYDPYSPPNKELFEAAEIDKLLCESDFVSIHVPLNSETQNLLNADKIGLLKNGAILINTSRGEIIDEAALLSALKNKSIAGAGLDVLQSEPYTSNDPLVLYSKNNHNLIITPHIGGFSPDALNIVLTFTCERINKFFNER